MEFQGQFYLKSAPAAASAGTIVLDPLREYTQMGEVTINSISMTVSAMKTTTCAKFIGTHLASCSRYLVSISKLM